MGSSSEDKVMKTEGKLAVIIGVVLAAILAAFFVFKGQPATTPGVALSNPTGNTLTPDTSATGMSREVEVVTPAAALVPPTTAPTTLPMTPLVPADSITEPPSVTVGPGATTQASTPSTQPSLGTVTPPTPAPRTGGSVDWNALLAGASTTAPGGATGPNVPSVGPRTSGVSPGSTLPPVTPSLSTPANSTTYTVKPGDSFSKISATVYGSPNFWAKIAQANPNVSSSKLRVGQVLIIPAESDVKALTATPAPSRTEGVTGSTLVKDPSREYRVQSGDSLHKISQRLYGSANRWEEIYDANKDVIGSSPTKLKIGMVLKLPAPPTATPAVGSSTRP